MTNEGKLEKARAELQEYEARNPRSREDVADEVKVYAENARAGRQDVPGLLGSGSRYGLETQYALVLGFVLDQPGFADWMIAQATVDGLPSRKERDRQLSKLRRVVSDAEAAVAREEIETKKAALERELAELGA